jgi:hypothetical protein
MKGNKLQEIKIINLNIRVFSEDSFCVLKDTFGATVFINIYIYIYIYICVCVCVCVSVV